MRVRFFAASFSAFILVSFFVAPASSQQLTKEWLQAQAQELVDDEVADGLSIGFIEGKNYGVVHAGAAVDGEKATSRTIYEIGSITKVFTSLLLADAVTRGDVVLDQSAKVSNRAEIRLPKLDGQSISWLQLSTHRSGLPRLPSNLQPIDLMNPYRNYDAKEAAKFLSSFQLSRAPGATQEYSNFAVSVLGYLVAEKAGQSYEDLLKKRIADPLGMSDCAIKLTSEQTKRFATPHNAFGSTASPWTFSNLPGAGGIRASMRDMMRFAKAQLTPPDNNLGKAIELAWKKHTDADASGSAMGLGWMIMVDGQTRWHNGQTGGYHSALFINRATKTAAIILCNTAVVKEIDELAIKIIRKAAGENVDRKRELASKNSGKPEDDPKYRSRLEGKYKLAPNFIFTVRDRRGHMMVGITNQPTQEVFPDSPTHWSYRSVDATLEFKLSKSGPAKSLVLHQNGIKQTARRMK